MKSKELFLIAFICTFLCTNSLAHALGELHTRLPGQPNADIIRQKLESSTVNVEIFDQLAMVTLDETFVVTPDTSQDTLLGAYTLKLPTGAKISELALWVNGVKQLQEILRREDAQRMPEGVLIGDDDPLFPKDDGENIFRIGLYPVTENSNNRIEVKYFLTLAKVGDVVEFKLPLSGASKSGVLKLNLKSQTPIDSIWTTNEIPIDCTSNKECSIDYSTSASFSDFTLNYTFAEQRLFTVLIYEDPAPLQDDYFMLWTTPPAEWFEVDTKIEDRQVVFCLDVSTGMGEELAPVRSILEIIINRLGSSDRFNIIAFDNSLNLLDSENFLSADPSNQANVAAFLRALEPTNEGSDLQSVLDEALVLFKKNSSNESAVKQIIVISKASPNVDITNKDAIRQLVRIANQDSVQIFPVRIKTSECENFFRELAQENFGELFSIADTDNLQDQVIQIIEQITLPTLMDVEFVDDSPLPNIRQFFPEIIPELSKDQQFLKTGRYGPRQVATLTLLANNGQTNLDTSEVMDFSIFTQTEFVSRFWATKKIDSLAPSDEDAIVELSQKFHVLSEFTAFPHLGDFVTSVSQENEEIIIPEDFSLLQNYPNPFNPKTTIVFRASTNNSVTLKVYNMLGQLVRVLVDEKKQPGEYAVTWDGRNDHNRLMPTGLYIYRLQVGAFQRSKKMLMVK